MADYKNWVKDVKQKYLSARLKAATAVNSFLVKFYWELGKDIEASSFKNTYGSNFFSKLAQDLRSEIPDEKGLSTQNLRYAHKFYLLYSQSLIFPQPVGILESQQKLPQAVEELEISANVPQPVEQFEVFEEFTTELFLVPWSHHRIIIDKLHDFPEKAIFYVKKTVENGWSRAVLLNMLDTKLHCYVVVELKITKFEPEFVSKLNFYCNAVNHLIKTPDDKETIGLLICKEKNSLVAQWTVEKSREPIAITEYELKNLIPVLKDENN